jgi:hypothetical protein
MAVSSKKRKVAEEMCVFQGRWALKGILNKRHSRGMVTVMEDYDLRGIMKLNTH